MSWWATDYHPLQAGTIDGNADRPHDKAITRANEYKGKRNAYKTLFVGRLNSKTTEKTLHDFFEKYGKIQKIRLVRDQITRASRCYGFIEYKHQRDFEIAFKNAHRNRIDGREILVDYERGRTMKGWVPRRRGGGLGGNKTSGQLRFGGRDRPFRLPIQRKGQNPKDNNIPVNQEKNERYTISHRRKDHAKACLYAREDHIRHYSPAKEKDKSSSSKRSSREKRHRSHSPNRYEHRKRSHRHQYHHDRHHRHHYHNNHNQASNKHNRTKSLDYISNDSDNDDDHKHKYYNHKYRSVRKNKSSKKHRHIPY